MDKSVQRQIREIANNAITEISRISQLVNSTHSAAASDQRSSSTSSPLSSGSASSALPSGSESGSSSRSSGSLVSELHRRFPSMQGTTHRSSTPTSSGRGRSNSTQRVGRPSNEFAIKDIIIVGLQCEKTPTTRQEKGSLQHRNRVISGFTIDKGWNEKTLYNKVKAQFPEECKDIEFEFVKNISGVLVKPTLASGVRINGNILLKSIASTGAVYVRLLVEDDPDEVDSGIQRSMDDFMSQVNQESIIVQDEVQSMNCEGPNTNRHKEEERTVEQGHAVESADDQERDSGEQHAPITADDQERGNGEQHVVQLAAHNEQPIDNGEPLSEADYLRIIDNITDNIIDECKGFQNPVAILKKAQEHILVGRQLDIVDPSTELKGKTNFIIIDRDHVFQDALAEVALIDNLRLPLEVNFMGEGAQDSGGPRKEFFRLVLKEIKEKLFDSGLIEDFAERYYTSGIIMGLSVLQNGKIPTFLSEEQLQELVDDSSEHNPCIVNLRNGLRKVGVLQLMAKLPLFLYLFRPSSSKLNVRNLVHLLEPKFAEEGSNTKRYEKEAYAAFYKYMKELASGRRVTGSTTLTLNHILQFVCGADEEPALGFSISPQIRFVSSSGSFLPTSNTCTNTLHLPSPSSTVSLPSDDILFNLYDYAFGSTYFGII